MIFENPATAVGGQLSEDDRINLNQAVQLLPGCQKRLFEYRRFFETQSHLYLILYGDRKTINKIGRAINQYRRLIKLVRQIEDKFAKRELLRMTRERYLEKVGNINADPRIISFANNLLKIYYKDALK